MNEDLSLVSLGNDGSRELIQSLSFLLAPFPVEENVLALYLSDRSIPDLTWLRFILIPFSFELISWDDLC